MSLKASPLQETTRWSLSHDSAWYTFSKSWASWNFIFYVNGANFCEVITLSSIEISNKRCLYPLYADYQIKTQSISGWSCWHRIAACAATNAICLVSNILLSTQNRQGTEIGWLMLRILMVTSVWLTRGWCGDKRPLIITFVKGYPMYRLSLRHKAKPCATTFLWR